MKIAITSKFQNSYFSGSLPQVCLFLGSALKNLNHEVHLLTENDSESKWFIDCLEHKKNVPDVVSYNASKTDQYDLLIEVIWSFSPEMRTKVAKQTVLFLHFPPLFHDLESSIYNFNGSKRNFNNINAVWTWDCANDDDIRYIEFLSGIQVSKIPILYDPSAIDVYMKESTVPSWSTSAKDVESKIPKDAPKSIDWCARILESNASNSSSAVLPLNIVANIRNTGNDIRWMVHNGDSIRQSDFLRANVLKNLNLGPLTDISGNLVGRLRFPDYARDKTIIVSHLRWRSFKYYMFDALYMGIPMIHNCAIAKNAGAQYYYELNQISDGVKCFAQIKSDYESKSGFFLPKAVEIRRMVLKQKYSPTSESNLTEINKALTRLEKASIRTPLKPLHLTSSMTVNPALNNSKDIHIAFMDMWENFQPSHNFFIHLLAFAGHHASPSFNVYVNNDNPNLIIYGPFGSKHQEHKYKGVSKIFYTGENLPPQKEHNTVLNLGFNYPEQNGLPYIRLPLWMLEINWFNQPAEKFVNPLPVSLEDAMKVYTPEKRSKFCAFVASNPSNQLRNAAFQIINTKYKPVESAGRLFTNRPEGVLPSSAGGGGGELIKVDYYKQFKFVLAFENSTAPGYTTEKIFHAKVAGAIPIYWGDPLVERDFDKNGFFNAGQCTTPDDLIAKVKELDENEELCMKMMSVPALSEEKKKQCEMIMGIFVKAVGAIVLKREVLLTDAHWKTAQSFVYELGTSSATPAQLPILSQPQPTIISKEAGSIVHHTKPSNKRVFVSAANKKFLQSAMMMFDSFEEVNKHTNQHVDEKILYVWPDVTKDDIEKLVSLGIIVKEFPIDSYKPYEDYFNPQHYAWKLFIQHNQLVSQPDNTSVLYMDAGVFITSSIHTLYETIEKQDIILFNDDEQINERWCHPVFNDFMKTTESELKANQLWAGTFGYKTNGKYADMFNEAHKIASNHRDVIVGDKWKPYSTVCMGHRHDQSILSILTHRVNAPRVALKEYYCDHSLTRSLNYNAPLYVHRGQFKNYANILPNIGEAYVVNLDRRADRLVEFKSNHPFLAKNTYKWRATDGKQIKLTPQIAHLFRDNDFKWKKPVMGCALSHFQLFEKCANDPKKVNYLILEDDVKFMKDWEKQWLTMASSIPKDADFIYFGGVLPPNKPALPMVTEKVNEHFAKVAKNTVFSMGAPRRYFHFCTYAYILTPSGAQKMMNLIMERGIFTSVDHMICNHGDSLFNIYFTTPLLAGCFQDDDPVYQTSQFNDFNRVDKFDSDIWNNNDYFTPDEITPVMTDILKKTMRVESVDSPSLVIEEIESKATPNNHESFNESFNELFNELIKHISMNSKDQCLILLNKVQSSFELNEKTIQLISILHQIVKFKKDEGFFQSIKTELSVFFHFVQTQINESNNSGFKRHIFNDLFDTIVHTPVHTKTNTTRLYTFPSTSLTCEKGWLEEIFDTTFEQIQVSDFSNIQANDFVLYQHSATGIQTIYYRALLDYLQKNNKQVYMLHISDEFGNDNIELYEHKAIKHVFRNYARNDIKQSNVTLLPLGYNTKSKSVEQKLFEKKEFVWSFAGAIDRPGRIENLKLLDKLEPNFVRTKSTFGAKSSVEGDEYIEMLNNSKFVPCFKGFSSLESFRLYEALETGSIPVYVPGESRSGLDNEYTRVLGKNPILAIPNWAAATMILEKVCGSPEIMEKHRQDLIAWWSQKKQELKATIKRILD